MSYKQLVSHHTNIVDKITEYTNLSNNAQCVHIAEFYVEMLEYYIDALGKSNETCKNYTGNDIPSIVEGYHYDWDYKGEYND